MTSQDRFSVPRSEVGNFLHRNANILLKITNVPWPTAGLACGSQILGLVIDLCGKARGADWITEDFFFSTAKCTCEFLVNYYRFFFIPVCDAIKIRNSMAKKYSRVKPNVFWKLCKQRCDYEKLLPEMKRKWNCTSCLETEECCLIVHEKTLILMSLWLYILGKWKIQSWCTTNF